MAGIGTGPLQTYEVTLSTDTSAYASGDLLADAQVVTDLFTPIGQTALVQSLTVIDQADQKAGFDVLFLNASTSLGTENSAAALTDAMALTVAGIITVEASDYVDVGGASIAQPQFNPLLLGAANNAQKNLWVAAISRGSPTYAADSLVLRLGIIR